MVYPYPPDLGILFRSYWHCLKPDAEPEHLICDTDENGEFMMWDTTYNTCNYAAYTDFGDRPTCDDCNQGCWTSPPEDEIDCGHDIGKLSFTVVILILDPRKSMIVIIVHHL